MKAPKAGHKEERVSEFSILATLFRDVFKAFITGFWES